MKNNTEWLTADAKAVSHSTQGNLAEKHTGHIAAQEFYRCSAAIFKTIEGKPNLALALEKTP